MRAGNIKFFILDDDFGDNILKLLTAKWRLLISKGMKIDANIEITIIEAKFVGKVIIA